MIMRDEAALIHEVEAGTIRITAMTPKNAGLQPFLQIKICMYIYEIDKHIYYLHYKRKSRVFQNC